MKQRGRGTFAVLGALLGLAWGPGALAQSSAECSTTGQNTYVRDTLQEYYFWYHELPDPNPASFESPEAYLEAVRYRPLDTTFSYIAGKAADDAFFSDSQFIGLGLSTRLLPPDELRVSQVFPSSPAAEGGLERGQRILAINGRTIADLVASDALGSAFGANDIGVSVEVLFRKLDGQEVRATMTKRLVTIPTVSLTKAFEVDGRRVGYIVFRNFVTPSFAALDDAFNQLLPLGVTDLVLDLRYNGGGLVSVAQHLAGLIGGVRTNGKTFCEFFHNDKNLFRNQTLLFEDKPNALDLERLIVITTRGSASASELVINALRPFVKVVIVGDTTYGKPVGQYSFSFCEKVLHPVAFTLRNALGQGDFFAGFPPDCAAGDDLDHAFGDPAEASLAEALTYVRTGACSAHAGGTATSLRRATRVRESGFQQLVGAN